MEQENIKETKQKILKALEDKTKCPKCKSEDTYKSNLRQGYSHGCNTCGEYF